MKITPNHILLMLNTPQQQVTGNTINWYFSEREDAFDCSTYFRPICLHSAATEKNVENKLGG